jgi:hypothetical protein
LYFNLGGLFLVKCTAPVRGHQSASAADNCPACRGSYGSRYSSYPSYSPSFSTRSSSYFSSSSTSRSKGKLKAKWSSSGSSITYTPSEIIALSPVRKTYEEKALKPELKDIFLCHAWDDRKGTAKMLCDLLEAKGVTVWFSEKDIPLGAPMMRKIDKGLANSRIGIVLVTPAFLDSVKKEGVADKELSVLLAESNTIPIVHNTTYDELHGVSPFLASRNGLNTTDDTLEDVANKLSELVTMVDE